MIEQEESPSPSSSLNNKFFGEDGELRDINFVSGRTMISQMNPKSGYQPPPGKRYTVNPGRKNDGPKARKSLGAEKNDRACRSSIQKTWGSNFVEEFGEIMTKERFEALSNYGLRVLQNLAQACPNVTEAVKALSLVVLEKQENRGILEPKDIKSAISNLAATNSPTATDSPATTNNPAATDKKKDTKRSYEEDGGVVVLKEPKKRRTQ